MPDIFINYRTGDVEHAASAIDRDLSHRFGSERIFFAGKTIPGGENYQTALLRGARTCAVLLAVIGPRWLAENTGGAVPLHDPDNWVRREILEAFATGARVIPILVGRRTDRLAAGELPKELTALADCQSLLYDHRTAENDLEQLSALITRFVPALVDRTRTASSGDCATPTSGTNNGIRNSPVSGTVTQFRDVSGTVHQGNTTHQQAEVGFISGGTIGTIVNRSNAPLHTGSGNQYTNTTGTGRQSDAGDDDV